MISVDAGKYLQNLIRRSDPIRKGLVVTAAHPTYTVKIVDTGATITATAGNAGPYLVNEEVLLQTGGSGRYARSAFVIIGNSQGVDNGAIVPAPDVKSEKSGETITQLPAYPVQLAAGGAVQRFSIFGERLSTTPTYGVGGITNAVAPAIDPSVIQFQVQAAGGTTPGLYSLTVAGKTIPDFFEVI